jgi:hypothetical protein
MSRTSIERDPPLKNYKVIEAGGSAAKPWPFGLHKTVVSL